MTIYVALHAARRYQDRIKQHLTLAGANRELAILCQEAEFVELPDSIKSEDGSKLFLELSDGIYGAMVEIGKDTYCMTTILVRGGYKPKERRAKNRKRAAVRYRKARDRRRRAPRVYHRDFSDDDGQLP